jgi:hypothetical protein
MRRRCSNEPKASASAWPHSMPPCSPIGLASALELLGQARIGAKSAGHCSSDSLMNCSRSAAAVATALRRGAASAGHGACFSLRQQRLLEARVDLGMRCDTNSFSTAPLPRRSAPSRTRRRPTPAAPSGACLMSRSCAWAACTSARRLRCARAGDSPRGRSARPSERCAVRVAMRMAMTHASMSSALTWKIGISKPLATSDA